MNWRRSFLLVGLALVLIGGLRLYTSFPTGAVPTEWAGLAVFVGFASLLVSVMPDKFAAIFIIPELRQKILLTLLFLAIYRVGYHIPLPFINQAEMNKNLDSSGPLGNILGYVSMFSGGNLSQATIFGLGIMPYISASIIFQLLAAVYPPLEKLRKEGASGQKKINEYTRYATVVICFFQAALYVRYIMNAPPSGLGWSIVHSGV